MRTSHASDLSKEPISGGVHNRWVELVITGTGQEVLLKLNVVQMRGLTSYVSAVSVVGVGGSAQTKSWLKEWSGV